MTRNKFQELTRLRIKEARFLLRAGYYNGAYYLAGLAVECALKACIARKTKRHDFPDKKVVDQSWSHDLTQLLRTAELQRFLEQESQSNPQFDRNWGAVKEWKVGSRYELHGRTEASDFYKAVTARSHGVLTWIRRHW